MAQKRVKPRRRSRASATTPVVEPAVPNPEPPAPPPRIWPDALQAFLELSKLEGKKIRLQALKLVEAIESEALAVFKIARRLELTLPNDPAVLKDYGRDEILKRLRKKFAADHVELAHVDTIDEQLGPSAKEWYRQGTSLLDCAETLSTHVAVYEYQLIHFRRFEGGRAPSVAFIYLAAEQQRFNKTDEQVARSLAAINVISSRETFIAQYKENVIKKHRLRWLQRQRDESARQ